MNNGSRGKVGTALDTWLGLGGAAASSTVLSVAVALCAGLLLAVDGGDQRGSDGPSDDDPDGPRVTAADCDSNGSVRDEEDPEQSGDEDTASIAESDPSQSSSSAAEPDVDDSDRESGPPSIVERVDEVLQRDDWEDSDDSDRTTHPDSESGDVSSATGGAARESSDSASATGDAPSEAGDTFHERDDTFHDTGDASGDSPTAASSDSDPIAAESEASAAQDAAGFGACQNCGATDADCEPRALGPRSLSVVLCETCDSARADRTRCLDDCRRTGVPLAATNADACEACGSTASLEAHAVVPIDANGHRHQNNLFALCPDCHAAVACHGDTGE